MRNLRAVYAANEEQQQEAAMCTLSAGSAAVLNDQMAVLSTEMAISTEQRTARDLLKQRLAMTMTGAPSQCLALL